MNLLLFIVGAAAGGAVAFGLWSLLPETWRAARWPVVVVVALMTGLNVATKVQLPATEVSIERDLLMSAATGEMARAWKQADPDTFADFVRDVRDASERGSQRDAMIGAGQNLAAAVTERLPYLSDAEAVAIEQNLRDSLRFFADFEPTACRTIATGGTPNLSENQLRSFPVEGRRLGEARMELLAAAFRADMQQPIDFMTGDELMEALAQVGEKMRVTMSEEDMALLSASGEALVGHERRYCEVMAEYENQLSLHPRAGPLYRGLVLMQQR